MEREKSYPGKNIGVIEEFESKNVGTYINGKGIIRSKYLGYIFKDLATRQIDVKPFRKPILINIGDKVIGGIINISGVYGYVKIEVINGKPLDRVFSGVIYPHTHVRMIDDVYRVGDYIIAKVESKVNRTIHLSMRGEENGVILAKCSYCGDKLKKIGKNALRCIRCGNVELRKLSRHYGKVI